MAKETFPVPTGKRIRDTYGNVINGKMNDDIVRRAFIIKFFFIELHLIIYLALPDSFLIDIFYFLKGHQKEL